jgi:hypothetical protein
MNYIDFYLIGVILSLLLLLITEKYFKQNLNKEIKEDIPDIEKNDKDSYLDTFDYIIIGLLSWISVIGVSYDLIRYYFQKSSK